MQIPENAGTREVTIQGHTFNVPEPYAEGHPLTENEAAALNQTFAENVRNNFAQKVKDANEAQGEENVDTSALQSELDSYIEGYEFGVRRSGGGGSRTPVDPVEREALRMAEDAVKNAIRAKGGKVSEFDNIKEVARTLLEKKPEIREAAQRRVDEMSNIGNELDDMV